MPARKKQKGKGNGARDHRRNDEAFVEIHEPFERSRMLRVNRRQRDALRRVQLAKEIKKQLRLPL